MNNHSLSEFNLIDLLKVAYQKRKIILWLTGIAFIVSIAVALLLPVYYKSSAIFYPTNLGLSDRTTIFSDEQNGSDFSYYGTKHDANRILSLAMSGKIVDFAINYFDLAKHYGYDTSSEKYWRTNVKKEFLENYSIIKTDKDAIEITLYDTDRELCAKIVNTIVEKIDEHVKTPINIGKARVMIMLDKQIKSKELEIGSLTDQIVAIKSEFKISTIGAGINTSFSGSNVQQVEKCKILFAKQQDLLEELKEINNVYAQYKVSAEDNVSAVTILENAYPAEKKSKPIRWLIVALGTSLTFLLSVFGALLFEQLKSVREKVIA
ncbi:MAG: hypothetical protein IPK03_14320 [Bacteroidetes bacterium]|nr:hypothetical protein [Bacteroidota bacterium]